MSRVDELRARVVADTAPQQTVCIPTTEREQRSDEIQAILDRGDRVHLKDGDRVVVNMTCRSPGSDLFDTEDVAFLLDELSAATERAERAEADRDKYRRRKDEAYTERNRLVALLCRLVISSGGVAGRHKHEPDPDPTWDPEWLTLVAIDLPTGQVSWHFHDSDAHLVAELPTYPGSWDGHDTPEKYRRVLACESIEAGKNCAETIATLVREKDRAEALAASRPDVSVEMAASLMEKLSDRSDDDFMDEWTPIAHALRAHAAKATTGERG